jgi:alpha-glucosidase (family GH31 glycosyl hydrolase)
MSTYGIDLRFFFGDWILVSPVTDEDATSVSIYLPKDQFYDFATLAPVDGTGQRVTLSNVSLTEIPLHICGGAALPLRAKGAMTTTELRAQDLQFVVAPGTDGTAAGTLYVRRRERHTEGDAERGDGVCEGQADSVSVWFLGVNQAPTTVWRPPGYHDTQTPVFV